MLRKVFHAIFSHPQNMLKIGVEIIETSYVTVPPYTAEHNLRMFVANNENVGDSIMKAIANTYGPTFM